MADTTASTPALPEHLERMLLDFADACFRCGAYQGSEDVSHFHMLSDHRTRMWESVTQAVRAALASQPVAPAVPLTDEQFAEEWHRRTGRIMGTDKALLLQAKYVTERAHGIATAPDTASASRHAQERPNVRGNAG